MRYLEQYPDGGYRYQRGVPADLVKLVGTGKRIKRHIGHAGIRDAEDRAARFAIEDSTLFARLPRTIDKRSLDIEDEGLCFEGFWRPHLLTRWLLSERHPQGKHIPEARKDQQQHGRHENACGPVAEDDAAQQVDFKAQSHGQRQHGDRDQA